MTALHASPERLRITDRARASKAETCARIQMAGLQPQQELLEVGCGSGVHAGALAVAMPQLQITCLEPDFGFATEAKARLKKLNNVQVKIGRAEQLPFADDRFDAYYARLVFQHCVAPLTALAEAHRVLRPGGVCMVDDIDRAWFTAWPEPPKLKTLWQDIAQEQHNSGGDSYIGRKLSSLMHQSGFKDVVTHIKTLVTDGSGIYEFVSDTGESLLELLPQEYRLSGRKILMDWALSAQSDPAAYQLSMGWFEVTGRA